MKKILLTIIFITITSFAYSQQILSTGYADNKNCEVVIGEPISVGNNSNITVGYLQGIANENSGLTENTIVQGKWIITPNPADSEIHIYAPQVLYDSNATISLYALTGSMVLKTILKVQSELTVDISHLTKSMYIIKITDENNSLLFAQKIIKK